MQHLLPPSHSVITEEVRNTLDTFKTDLQNMLPQEIRLVV
jgi:hypothetical protein